MRHLQITQEEVEWLQEACPHLSHSYLDFLKQFRFDPERHIVASFEPAGADADLGDIHLGVEGLWTETTLYEVPLLALTSATYFRWMDQDWTHDDQEKKAYTKGMRLLKSGCVFGEYGTRRRRDYFTHELVVKGLVRARHDSGNAGFPGVMSGTSNVYLAMQYGLKPMGTVGHEWFMGIASLCGDYRASTMIALAYWLDCFGRDFWLIAPTDTFGTPVFLETFQQRIPDIKDIPVYGTFGQQTNNMASRRSEGPTGSPFGSGETFAGVFKGVRQDSGDPVRFIATMKAYYTKIGIDAQKTLVFSDSLVVDDCLRYKPLAENAGFQATFGIGTSFANDFVKASTGLRSTPLNAVMKPKSFNGNAVVKLSDTGGKNSGDEALVRGVKHQLSYLETSWDGGDETTRWGRDDEAVGNDDPAENGERPLMEQVTVL